MKNGEMEFTYTAEVTIKAKNGEDAYRKLVRLMDKHNIHWDLQEE